MTSKQYLNAPDNTFASIFATLASGLKPFMHLKDSTDNNVAFSFKQYIREEYQRTNGTIPNLYLLVSANRQRIMAPLLSLVMDIMINQALTLPESQNCRLYFIIDEIGRISKIQLLPDLITKGRSYGISILALTQDSGLLRGKYGPQVMQSFLNNFGTQIVLRINDAATAKELADNFGVEKIIEYKKSIQLPQNGSPIPSICQDTTTKSLILPSQLQSLPPFKGYGKILGFNPFNLVIPQLFFNKKNNIKHFDPINRKTVN
nr:type IV secretion system DNA-binding domain-containing protein [Veillonella sp. VA137]